MTIDFTQQELRPLIYRDRLSIDEFDVNNPKSLDWLMLNLIEDSKIVELDGAAEYILEIFNNAYYITTLILMEPHPLHYFRSYITIAEHAGSDYKDITAHNTFYRYFECFTMGMVCNYLCQYDHTKFHWIDNNRLLKKIWDFHNTDFTPDTRDSNARFLYFKSVIQSDSLFTYHINKKDFTPLHSPEELEAIVTKGQQPEGSNNPEIERLTNLVSEKDNEIKDLKKQMKKLQDAVSDYEQAEKDEKGVSSQKAAILITTICHHLGGLPQNGRQTLYPLLQELWGFSESTAMRALGVKFNQKNVHDLAELFEGCSPKISTLIKEIPETLKTLEQKRLSTLHKSKNVKET